ncbi:SF1B family DNA helicase RecD2 [Spiroplasma endosymbiont of Amphibalanus improvisus]|uniref:SF1B family DNA helicase RecD2 n=1 Tax=Spiroplasma endosymbiont of Amphibalanus improvisus TaxID=3066327 RepID=UPI00313CFC2A
MELETVTGKLLKIVFESNNGFIIAHFKTEDKKTISIKGNLSVMNENKTYDLKGSWTQNNPKYQPSFNVSEIIEKKISDNKSLIQYLSSPLFPSIGPVMAKRIVETLGIECLEIIDNHPEQLQEIKGLKQEQIDILCKIIVENKQEQEIIQKFNKFKIDYKIFEKLKNIYSLSKIKELLSVNPYSILEIDDSVSSSFDALDKLFLGFVGEPFAKLRIGYVGWYFAKKDNARTGNTYLELDDLKKMIVNFVSSHRNNYDLPDNAIIEGLIYAKENGLLLFKDKKVFLPWFYNAEYEISQFLNKLNQIVEIENEQFLEIVQQYQKSNSIVYDSTQIEALKKAVFNKFSIITGGPGTGKTTVIKGLLNLFNKIYDKPKILLAAPTGKAAKRIKEQTNMNASTIHKLLEWNPSDTDSNFERDKIIKADILIVDESSMVDLILFKNLISYLPDVKHLILIGDPNQLPSIQAGNVLADIIDSKKFPVTYLKQVYRQSEENHIIDLCYSVLSADINFEFDNKKDVTFLHYDDDQEILEQVITNYIELTKQEGINPINDIQIAIPKYRGVTGIDAVNDQIQKYNLIVNTPNQSIKIMNQVFYPNDKIMQTKNRPELDIYNGDTGIIEEIVFERDKKKTIRANFNNTIITYPSDTLTDIKLSYAASVHKLQGSEYNNLILVVNFRDIFMLNKNLIYTAISRSKQKLIIIGQHQAWLRAINTDSVKRLTMLKERINE